MVVAIPVHGDVIATRPARGNQHHARLAAAAVLLGGSTMAAAAVSRQLHLAQRRQQRPGFREQSRPQLHHLAVDAISGAVGEVAALIALYPLDTIKVQCQARGASTAAVLQSLRAVGPSAALRQLYAGCAGTALGAAALGSIYLVTFYAAKRLGEAVLAAQPQGGGSGGGSGSAAAGKGAVLAAAGAAASIVSSLVEAPIEQFKVRTQAGVGQGGGMLSSMARLVAAQGLAPLYATLLPFLLKSLPHDITELATFGALTDLRAASATAQLGPSDGRPGSWPQQAGASFAALPQRAADVLMGGAAGAAAAVASMPFDSVFTRMQLGAGGAAAGGFVATARQIVAEGGGRALFAGLAPRLAQTVPAGVVYWVAVEACRRALTEHCQVVGEPQQAPRAAAAAAAEWERKERVEEAPAALAPC